MKKLFLSFFLLAIASSVFCSEHESRNKAKLIGKLFAMKQTTLFKKEDQEAFQKVVGELEKKNSIAIEILKIQLPTFYRVLLISAPHGTNVSYDIDGIKQDLEKKINEPGNEQLKDLVIATSPLG